ncbi:ketoacyl-ACP synthase III [Corallococcus sp. H22C18031201]|nr:ketoacyl-ACP synthase III [Corallococcus sp. H22C18031201]
MIPVRILGTAGVLPGRAVSTEEVCAQVGRAPEEVKRKTGIHVRYHAPPGTQSSELAAQALEKALERAELPARALRRIIYVSSIGGDVTAPATANRIAARLGLAGECDAMDLNNACMGFLTAFDLAARSVATGLGPVGIVSVEMSTRAMTPEDPRPYLVFGDAAAAAVLGEARPGEGVLGSAFGNNGTLPPDVMMQNPQLTGQREWMRFLTHSKEMTRVALDAVLTATRAALTQAQVSLRDVEWVLPHQPNGSMLDTMLQVLEVPAERSIRVVHKTGSIGSASLGTSLDELMRSGRVRPGERVLLVGVGAGVSYGAVLYRVGG